MVIKLSSTTGNVRMCVCVYVCVLYVLDYRSKLTLVQLFHAVVLYWTSVDILKIVMHFVRLLCNNAKYNCRIVCITTITTRRDHMWIHQSEKFPAFNFWYLVFFRKCSAIPVSARAPSDVNRHSSFTKSDKALLKVPKSVTYLYFTQHGVNVTQIHSGDVYLDCK